MLRIEAKAARLWTALLGLNGEGAGVGEWAQATEALDFPDDTFDAVVCPLGMSLVQGVRQALAEWRRVTKAGGSVTATALGGSALRPLSDLYAEQLFEYGLSPVAGAALFPWRRCANPETLRRAFREAGFAEVGVVVEQRGRQLADAEEWWRILEASGLTAPLGSLPEADAARFKAEHLHEASLLATPAGIWLDLPLASVVGWK